MKQMIGVTIALFGFMAMAGSANDCDGRCIEQANDIVTMLMVAGAGLIAVIFGTSLAATK